MGRMLSMVGRSRKPSRTSSQIGESKLDDVLFDDWLQSITVTREELAAIVTSPDRTIYETKRRLRAATSSRLDYGPAARR